MGAFYDDIPHSVVDWIKCVLLSFLHRSSSSTRIADRHLARHRRHLSTPRSCRLTSC